MAYSNTCTVLLLVHNDLDNSDTPLKAIMEFRIPPSPDPAIDDSGKIRLPLLSTQENVLTIRPEGQRWQETHLIRID